MTPRERHLAKAKPPALDQRGGQAAGPDLGPTDPHLRRYKQQNNKPSGPGKTILMVVIGLVASLILVVVLMILVPAVNNAIRPMLPGGLQSFFEGFLPKDDTPAQAAPAATPSTDDTPGADDG